MFGNWSGLPPLFFLAGSTEMLLDDSVRAHDRAQQARTNSRIDVWPDMPHVFPLFSMLPEAKQALGDIVAFIDEHARKRGRPAADRQHRRQAWTRHSTSGFAAAEPANRESL